MPHVRAPAQAPAARGPIWVLAVVEVEAEVGAQPKWPPEGAQKLRGLSGCGAVAPPPGWSRNCIGRTSRACAGCAGGVRALPQCEICLCRRGNGRRTTTELGAVSGPQWQRRPARPLSFGLSPNGPHAVAHAPPTPATGAQRGCAGAQADVCAGASAIRPAALHDGHSAGTGRPGRLGAPAGVKPGWS